jgi:hypothetical protein
LLQVNFMPWWVLGGVWDGSRFQLQCGVVVYNINLNSF